MAAVPSDEESEPRNTPAGLPFGHDYSPRLASGRIACSEDAAIKTVAGPNKSIQFKPIGTPVRNDETTQIK
ncbi:hypothetical protein RSSM_00856 [Rhodopirellula sallentina SM41]|uniref:Uncharacterized protein n=1 Tax=Rhodopirellula sallentina SM41 TaxID=1263870 RepID=M5UNY8_9BACT|nr:hypothetical protein RSSM_00856 [Rhodopirellula sallentina SM41]